MPPRWDGGASHDLDAAYALCARSAGSVDVIEFDTLTRTKGERVDELVDVYESRDAVVTDHLPELAHHVPMPHRPAHEPISRYWGRCRLVVT